MSKIIIHNKTELSDEEVMQRVLMVIQEGKISKLKNGQSMYCRATVFKSGIAVICDKLKGETYTFRIERS